MMKKEDIFKKLREVNVCGTGIYKLLRSGFLNEDFENIKTIRIDHGDFNDLVFFIETFKLDMKIETTDMCDGILTYTKGKLTREDRPDGKWETWEYDERGNLTRWNDSDGFWETKEYDERGNRTRYANYNGYLETREYDERGNQTRYENSSGYWENWEYDANGNFLNIKISNPPEINIYEILERKT